VAFRNPQGIHRLSAAAIKYITDPGWHSDGGGLYLEVDTNGRKRWAMRLTVNGKRRDFGLGPIHKVSLLEARERATEYRSKAYRGIDPVADKRRVEEPPPRNVLTFEQASRQVHEQRRATWSNGKHVDQWINTLFDHVFPIIGDKPVDEIRTPDVLNVLTPIWTTKPETARRVKQRVATVLDWARVAGHRSGDNPAELLGDALPRHRREQQHHAALPYTEVSQFIAKLRAGTAEPITKIAFEFLILTTVRTTEVRKASWDEVDFAARTWTIPGHRMKAGRDHVVPLSGRSLELLGQAKRLSADQTLIFPDAHPGRTMSENRFLVARDALGYGKNKCTPHGFRSSFRDWAAEETTFPAEVAEMALAHTIKNKVEAAYRRGHLLTKRAELMEAWAQYATPAP
jgi:integrase